jgi:hypothetical protein
VKFGERGHVACSLHFPGKLGKYEFGGWGLFFDGTGAEIVVVSHSGRLVWGRGVQRLGKCRRLQHCVLNFRWRGNLGFLIGNTDFVVRENGIRRRIIGNHLVYNISSI